MYISEGIHYAFLVILYGMLSTDILTRSMACTNFTLYVLGLYVSLLNMQLSKVE